MRMILLPEKQKQCPACRRIWPTENTINQARADLKPNYNVGAHCMLFWVDTVDPLRRRNDAHGLMQSAPTLEDMAIVNRKDNIGYGVSGTATVRHNSDL